MTVPVFPATKASATRPPRSGARRQARSCSAVLLTAALLVLPVAEPAGRSAFAQQPQARPTDAVAQRLTRLEEQIVDLQVVIGTLQSLAQRGPVAQGPGPSAGPGPGGGADAGTLARIDALETQISALTSQIEQMGNEIARLQARLGAAPGAAPGGAPGFGAPPLESAPALQPQQPSFGTTTVTPNQTQALPQGDQAPLPPMPGQWSVPGSGQTAALSPGDPKAAYEEAYGHMMRRDYQAAEAAFKRFLATYPRDELAGNAQYWLGETYYVRGMYKPAADAFLLSYRDYPTGNKAPDSLLRLAMALAQLGERGAACDSLSALNTKFPDAPQHVRQKAASEIRRNGC